MLRSPPAWPKCDWLDGVGRSDLWMGAALLARVDAGRTTMVLASLNLVSVRAICSIGDRSQQSAHKEAYQDWEEPLFET